jgi:anti-anti-sigma factor
VAFTIAGGTGSCQDIQEKGMSFYTKTTPAGAPGPCDTIPVSQHGHTALLCATAPLDLIGAAEFLKRARPLLRSSCCLVVDLQDVEFVDSAGVRMLLCLADELEEAGKELRLVVRPGSRVERTLGLLRLLQRFRVFATLQQAWTGRESIAAQA